MFLHRLHRDHQMQKQAFQQLSGNPHAALLQHWHSSHISLKELPSSSSTLLLPHHYSTALKQHSLSS